MFDTFLSDLSLIKTDRFHLIDGPANHELRIAVERCPIPFPDSYIQFVLKFGNAQLFRRSTGYQIQILAAPTELCAPDGELLYQFGKSASSFAYFKHSLLVGGESTVFEQYYPIGLRKTGIGFEEWFEKKYRAARRQFKKDEWQRILQGPPLFNDEELRIVDARRKFRWQRVGIAENGNIQFLVTNDSDLILPYLSLGVRGTQGVVDGGAWLPVHDLEPGSSKVLEFDCYKKYVRPSEIEVYDLPDPHPEDREYYWEFRADLTLPR